MSFIYPDLRDRERTCIKEKVKSRDKYTHSEFPYNPVKMTVSNHKICSHFDDILLHLLTSVNIYADLLKFVNIC